MNIIIASRSKAVKLAKEIPGAWIISMCDRDSEYVFFGELPRDILFMRFDGQIPSPDLMVQAGLVSKLHRNSENL